MEYWPNWSDRSHSMLAHLRREYTRGGLRRKDLKANPFDQFKKWFQAAQKARFKDPNAMVLATADALGRPSARTVLLKGLDKRGFIFFTNYQSQKASEISENPHAALVFFWPKLERQVCITGGVRPISRREAEAYFNIRPLGSRMATWVSMQSQVIESRKNLEAGLKRLMSKASHGPVPMPDYWGGYVLFPKTIEFWQGRPNRLHDRFRYCWKRGGKWVIERLAP